MSNPRVNLEELAKTIRLAVIQGARFARAKSANFTPEELSQGQIVLANPVRPKPVWKYRRNPILLRRSPVVRISLPKNSLVIEANISVSKLRRCLVWKQRLNLVLQTYSHGLMKILEHAGETLGSRFLHLDLSDGGWPYPPKITSRDNLYAFTRQKNNSQVGLLPDPYSLYDILDDVPYPAFDNKEEARAAYARRAAVLFWRGATTGKMNETDILSNRRIRFCAESRKFPDQVDARITGVTQVSDISAIHSQLQHSGIIGPHVPEREFANHAATIDLEGNSAAWGTFRKHLMLVHVIRPDSEFEMFYNIDQPDGTVSRVSDIDDYYQKLALGNIQAAKFEVAWSGYQYARQIRSKIIAGNATVFPE